MISYPVARLALSSMNYLFLEHAIHSIDVTCNETIEGELETFLSSLPLYDETQEYELIYNYIRDDIVQTIVEGPYLEMLSPEEFKSEIKDSIYIIMGTEHRRLQDFYNQCVDQAALQLQRNIDDDLQERAL